MLLSGSGSILRRRFPRCLVPADWRSIVADALGASALWVSSSFSASSFRFRDAREAFARHESEQYRLRSRLAMKTAPQGMWWQRFS